MAIYIPLEAALKCCDRMERNIREDYGNVKFYINYDQMGYIFSLIAEKCGKYIPDDNEVLFVPQILPESSDPKGSKRYRCYIRNEKYPSTTRYDISYHLNINTSTFTIKEYSDEFTKIDVVSGMGTVVQDLNGKYSWWFDDMNKGLNLNDIK